ncbi:MAG TPA: hypothetical protein VFN61_07025 [Acidimicrobiales bacterium]|nr:hypothetical protein [Acidimicrobiales bacterium]
MTVLPGLVPPASAASAASGTSTNKQAGKVSAQPIPPGATVLTPPQVPGSPALPGPVLDPPTPAPNIGILSVSPDQGPVGTPITVTGAHLRAHTTVEITWSTAETSWMVQAKPDTVNYLGRYSKPVTTVIGSASTDGQGRLSFQTKAPLDFGGIHDIYAVAGNTDLAHGGFLTTRTVTVSPTSGPIGTPITITYTGLGASLYTGGASLLYDNHYAGELMANWTRGVAQAVIRASGPVGRHTIQIGNAISYLYLNVPQSPIPYTNGAAVTFTVTKDSGPPAASLSWPADVVPTSSSRTTLTKAGLATTSSVKASLSASRGQVGSRISLDATGLTSSAPVELSWSTVVGNRVDCASTCWAFASSPVGTAAPSNGSLQTHLTVPDGLGGWHVVQLSQSGKVLAQLPFYTEESIVGQGVSSIVVKEGQSFTVHLKGVGWTQLDNTVGVDYDNSYVGYGCGFNSNGDVLVHLYATGGPGTHLIDMYPMLYSLSPSFSSTPYGMVPVLTYAHDDPGLALGYRLPSLHFAITVVK